MTMCLYPAGMYCYTSFISTVLFIIAVLIPFLLLFSFIVTLYLCMLPSDCDLKTLPLLTNKKNVIIYKYITQVIQKNFKNYGALLVLV